MDHRIAAGLAIAAACLAFALGAASTEAPAVLKKSPPIDKDVEAFPRIVARTPQAKAINAALARGDARVRQAVAECKNNGGEWDYSRSIGAPMRGPGFVSLYVFDNSYCGGNHPNTDQIALTYDLSTGRPITWAKYLPERFVQPQERWQAGDGTVIGVIKAPALLEWFRTRAVAARDASVDADCREALQAVGSVVLYIDAQAGGVVIEAADLPHVVEACAESVVITTTELRKLGASPKLIDAIDTAHRARD
jgi:hypothetical protein